MSYLEDCKCVRAYVLHIHGGLYVYVYVHPTWWLCVYTHICHSGMTPRQDTHNAYPAPGRMDTFISVEHSYILHTLSTQDKYTHVHTTLQTRHTHTTYIPSTQGKYIYILLHHVYLCVLHRGNAYLYVCFLCRGVVYVCICMSYLESCVFPNKGCMHVCVCVSNMEDVY